MIKIALFGCNGKMGQVISNLLSNDEDAKISFGFDINTERKNSYPVYDKIENIKEDADVVIDFSHPALLDSLISYCRKTKTGAVIATTGLSKEQIDEIDEQLLAILAKRNRVSREIGIYKKENNMPVLQTGRYNEILEKRAQMGEAMNLDKEFVFAIMKAIHEESVKIQLHL